jgi:hypothetical protein
MSALSPSAPPEARRRLQRRPTSIPTRIGNSDLRRAPARIVDITVLGCRIELTSRVNPRDFLTVTVPGLGVLGAVVVWAQGASAGLQFRQPLHDAVLRHLLAQVGSVASA